MTAKWEHVQLLATPITKSVPAMWFYNVFRRKSTGPHQARKLIQTTSHDPYSSRWASVDHVCVLLSYAALEREGV